MALTHSHYLRYRRGGNTYTKYGNTIKQTTPSIAFRAGGKTYYIPLSRANPTTSYPVGVRYNNNTYRIGTASATFSAQVMATQQGVNSTVIMGAFSLSNGGFDQSWKLSVRLYNLVGNEIPSQYATINSKTYSASTTSGSTFTIATTTMPVYYLQVVITVFGTTYTSEKYNVNRQVQNASLTVT